MEESYTTQKSFRAKNKMLQIMNQKNKSREEKAPKKCVLLTDSSVNLLYVLSVQEIQQFMAPVFIYVVIWCQLLSDIQMRLSLAKTNEETNSTKILF